jgi:cellulose synthase/poly-beta-1,6-N-acetylglucosamine synthase-like glycosyltransferase
MSTTTERTTDPRLRPPTWDAARSPHPVLVRALVCALVPLALFYFAWLLAPDRIGQPALYVLLVGAELFNAVQALGFWWTCAGERRRRHATWEGPAPAVDVLVPVYGEPVAVVEATIAAAVRLRGADVRVHVLDDGASEDMRAMAERQGADYLRRPDRGGAKAGNLNHALARTAAPFVAVLDCDHVPDERFLEATLGYLADPRAAFAQAPQYYANHDRGEVPAAAWSQQALFFGPIARGKDGHDAMFCCGTNVVFRRAALEDVGGFPQESVTEDFELSIHLHEAGWTSHYIPQVLASGLGPEDMASYVSQQQRWARGCLAALPAVVRSSLPLRLKAQYALSASYFLTGWTVLVYMSFPVVRLLTGAQPLAAVSADQFLGHFVPYFGFALLAVMAFGRGTYSFRALALQAASFWIHVQATLLVLLRRPGSFVVTPKQGARERQPRTVAPALAAIAVLVSVAATGLLRNRDPATLNNVAFAVLHICVLTAGVLPALRRAPVPEKAAAPAPAAVGGRRARVREAVTA